MTSFFKQTTIFLWYYHDHIEVTHNVSFGLFVTIWAV